MSNLAVEYHLAYFNLKGLGEIIRIVFSATETPFEDYRYPISFPQGAAPLKPEFDAIKHTLPFGQVPLLDMIIIDQNHLCEKLFMYRSVLYRLTVKKGGKVFQIAQSKAIERYVAKQTGLMGSSDEEAALIDGVGELVNDLKSKFNAAKGDHVELTKFINDVLPLQLSYVEKFIDSYGSGYVIGNTVSLADIQLYYYLTTFIPAEHKVTEIISDKIALLITQVASLPGIVKWEAGRAARNEPF